MLEVLICDDSLVARKQVAKCLPQDMEGAVHFAKHGEDALDLITNSKVDLLLLDLNMPVLDGYGTLKEMQSLLGSLNFACRVVAPEESFLHKID